MCLLPWRQEAHTPFKTGHLHSRIDSTKSVLINISINLCKWQIFKSQQTTHLPVSSRMHLDIEDTRQQRYEAIKIKDMKIYSQLSLITDARSTTVSTDYTSLKRTPL